MSAISITIANSGWDTVTAIATASAAIVTAVMAYQTRRMAAQTEEEAKATVKAAEAAKSSADATLELARLGQLAYQPALARQQQGATGHLRRVQLTNLGAGGALDVLYATREASKWAATAVIHLAPGEQSMQTSSDRTVMSEVPTYWFDTSGSGTPIDEVMFCRDVLGNRYRFLVDAGGHGAPVEVRKPEETGDGSLSWWNDQRLWSVPLGS